MIGREIGGRYRLTAPLGEGGMSTLWRAVDQQLDREVAVKILRPQYSADPGFAARFRQEARPVASLAHPNIVSVYDSGTDPDGTTLGSVHYFSPEQARGDEVTGRSDVYALGIVLYEMLTGHRPFEGDSAAGVALKRLTENPPRPMVGGQPLPSGLEAILRRALE